VAKKRWRNKGLQKTSHLTVNGWVEIHRRVYWLSGQGTAAPADRWLGIAAQRYSPGVREMCCREAGTDSFRRAAEDLARIGQIQISHETMRRIVEAEAAVAAGCQQQGRLRPEWSARDCRDPAAESTCVIAGADGVKVPLVTEVEKAKRRQLRRRRGPKARRRRRRMARGSDQAYKEFKLATFYDPSKDHQYTIGTSGNHEVLGRLMRRVAGWIDLGAADTSYSVSDGADWIRRQFNQRLPMLEVNILDYFHLREHVVKASQRVFGESSPEAEAWREEMIGVILEKGAWAFLDQVGELRRSLRSKTKRKALEKLRDYVGKRVQMADYPAFRAKGYDIGSGPTEACCKTLTLRLKGQGMRWDRRNAEGIMSLAAIRSSRLWDRYWDHQRKQVA